MANALKHGIDFEAAQALWADARSAFARARVGPEARFVIVGKIGDRHWTAVFTPRGENIRIISVRRSRAEEIARYEENHG